MKIPKNNPLLRCALIASALGTLASHAGEIVPSTGGAVSTITTDSESRLSGWASFDFNTHFISYGADVWKDGSSLSSPAFNPSLELAWALTDSLSFTLGTWWDVNSKAGGNSSPIGGRIQEIDIWTGLSYSVGDFSAGIVFNQWFYASESEDSIDFKFAYDTFLSPSLTIHHRIDSGASGGDEGTVLVFGLGYDVEAGPVTFSFPLSIAYFADEGFHGTGPVFLGGSDSGLGYGSLGVSAAIPLSFISEAYGEWTAKAGVTYYVTSRDVIPGNPKGDFLTASVGIGVSF